MFSITKVYKLMMGMVKIRCYESHFSNNWWWEWEEKDIMKHKITLQIDDGNGKKHMLSKIQIPQRIDDANGKKHILSNITYLYIKMTGMKINTCYQTYYTYKCWRWKLKEKDIIKHHIPVKNWWWLWEETHVIKHQILLQNDDGNGNKHKKSNIKYLYKFMMGMLSNKCYQTSHTSKNWWW